MNTSTQITCSIHISIFKASPYDLPWGASIVAKVISINIYGDSAESLEGNGAIITTTPDVPTDLAEDYNERTKSALGITWVEPVFTGGAIIDDYRISIAVLGEDYEVLELGILPEYYTAINLQFGITYQFRVESRNIYSYSAYSEVITLYCGFKPEPPTVVTTTNVNN